MNKFKILISFILIPFCLAGQSSTEIDLTNLSVFAKYRHGHRTRLNDFKNPYGGSFLYEVQLINGNTLNYKYHEIAEKGQVLGCDSILSIKCRLDYTNSQSYEPIEHIIQCGDLNNDVELEFRRTGFEGYAYSGLTSKVGMLAFEPLPNSLIAFEEGDIREISIITDYYNQVKLPVYPKLYKSQDINKFAEKNEILDTENPIVQVSLYYNQAFLRQIVENNPEKLYIILLHEADHINNRHESAATQELNADYFSGMSMRFHHPQFTLNQLENSFLDLLSDYTPPKNYPTPEERLHAFRSGWLKEDATQTIQYNRDQRQYADRLNIIIKEYSKDPLLAIKQLNNLSDTQLGQELRIRKRQLLSRYYLQLNELSTSFHQIHNAIANIDQLVILDPSNEAKYRTQRANINYSMRYYNDAALDLNWLKQNSELNGLELAALLYKLGSINYHLDKFEDAISNLDESIKLDPTNTLAFKLRAMSNWKINNNFGQIFSDLNNAYKVELDQITHKSRLNDIMDLRNKIFKAALADKFEQKKYKEYILFFNKFNRYCSISNESYINLGLSYFQLKQYHESIQVLSKYSINEKTLDFIDEGLSQIPDSIEESYNWVLQNKEQLPLNFINRSRAITTLREYYNNNRRFPNKTIDNNIEFLNGLYDHSLMNKISKVIVEK